MRFSMIGVGYIAPKHMKAIRDVKGELVAAMDTHDSVGILDSYFPDCKFFVEQERFERFLRKNPVDYFVVCTPNYLHDSHIWTGLGLGCKVICEKPVVVSPWNLKPLFGKEVNIIQQLRLCDLSPFDVDFANIEIFYSTPRGCWYDVSWKGKEEKSGGLIYNIGIHFIDLMCSLYGRPHKIAVFESNKRQCSGHLTFKKASVYWNLSIEGDKDRNITVNGKRVTLDSFEDLHTLSYQKILEGKGFKPEDVYDSIDTAYRIKNGS